MRFIGRVPSGLCVDLETRAALFLRTSSANFHASRIVANHHRHPSIISNREKEIRRTFVSSARSVVAFDILRERSSNIVRSDYFFSTRLSFLSSSYALRYAYELVTGTRKLLGIPSRVDTSTSPLGSPCRLRRKAMLSRRREEEEKWRQIVTRLFLVLTPTRYAFNGEH